LGGKSTSIEAGSREKGRTLQKLFEEFKQVKHHLVKNVKHSYAVMDKFPWLELAVFES